MSTETTKAVPFLSDENAPPLSTEYVTRIAKEVHDESPNTEVACIGMALAVRDIYNLELQRLRGLLDEARKAGDEMHKMLAEVKYNVQRTDEDYASDLDFAMTCWKRIDFTP